MPNRAINLIDEPESLAATDTSLGFSSPFVSSFTSGQTSGIAQGHNRNAGKISHLEFYATGNGIVTGLTVTIDGANIVVGSGTILIGGLTSIDEDVLIPLPGSGTHYIFVNMVGVPTIGVSSVVPSNSARIACLTKVGNAWYIDDEFDILRIKDGVSWVKFFELGYQEIDILADYIETRDGVYIQMPDGSLMLQSVIAQCRRIDKSYLPTEYDLTLPEIFEVVGNFFVGGNLYVA